MGETTTTVTIGARFNGPATSGNGGYVCGLVARHIDGSAEVTLWTAPPLERPLSLSADEPTVRLWDGDTLVAEAVAASVSARPPVTVSLAEAERASQGYPGFAQHRFPTCFVCGPDRSAGDGLRVCPGPVPGRTAAGSSGASAPVAAAPWTPPAELADADGCVRPEIVWAVLDCPSYFGGVGEGTPAVLGRLAADLRAPILAGEPHVVVGWPQGGERRKHYAAAAVTRPDGEVLAVSSATWIEPRRAAADAGHPTGA